MIFFLITLLVQWKDKMEEKLKLVIHCRGLVLPSQRVPVFHMFHYHDLTAWRHRFSLVDLPALSTCLRTNNVWGFPLLSESTNLTPWRCKKKSKNQVTPVLVLLLKGSGTELPESSRCRHGREWEDSEVLGPGKVRMRVREFQSATFED